MCQCLFCYLVARDFLTEVSVGQSLEQAGLLVTGRSPDAGGQGAQIRLGDLQGHVGCRAHVELRGSGYGVVS